MYKCIPPARPPQHIRRKCQHRASGFCYATLCRRLYMVSFMSPTRPQRQAYTHFFPFRKKSSIITLDMWKSIFHRRPPSSIIIFQKCINTFLYVFIYIGTNFAVRIEHERRDTQPRKPSSNAKCAGVLDGLPLPPPSLYATLLYHTTAYNFAI